MTPDETLVKPASDDIFPFGSNSLQADGILLDSLGAIDTDDLNAWELNFLNCLLRKRKQKAELWQGLNNGQRLNVQKITQRLGV